MDHAVSAYVSALEAAFHANATLFVTALTLQHALCAAVTIPFFDALMPPSRAKRSVTRVVHSPFGRHAVIHTDFSTARSGG